MLQFLGFLMHNAVKNATFSRVFMHNALKNATISRVSHTWKDKARAQRISLCGPETPEQPMCCSDMSKKNKSLEEICHE